MGFWTLEIIWITMINSFLQQQKKKKKKNQNSIDQRGENDEDGTRKRCPKRLR
jgi:hypothetical protein